jgi:hypothetical protein
MEDLPVVAQTVSSIIHSSPSTGVLGSDLTILLRQKHPQFRPAFYGCRNLRDFVKRFVPLVFESGRRGLDVIYSPVSSAPSAVPSVPVVPEARPEAVEPSPTATQQGLTEPAPSGFRDLEVDPVVWKTYVSPNSPFRLYVNPRTCLARVVDGSDAELSEPWLFVPPCSAPKHLEIARQFVTELENADARRRLEGALQNDVWWLPFFSLARALDLGKEWASFRSRKLTSELRKALESLGVRLPPRARLRLEGTVGAAAPSGAPQRSVSLLRRLAQKAVAEMSESELRKLRLPLGYIVDQLDNER